LHDRNIQSQKGPDRLVGFTPGIDEYKEEVVTLDKLFLY